MNPHAEAADEQVCCRQIYQIAIYSTPGSPVESYAKKLWTVAVLALTERIIPPLTEPDPKEGAQRICVSPSVINRLWRRFQETNFYGRILSQGHHRCTTAREDCYIVTTTLRGRLATAQSLRNYLQHSTGTRVSTQTVRNRLHKGRLRTRRPARSVILTTRHHAARLEFTLQHLDWDFRQWATLLWTDESRFTVSRDNGRARVWRRRQKRFSACNIVQVDAYGGGSVTVWTGICTGVL
ncbi:uncharacterized protein LOC143228362 [Tachypleus tridentatus]|uniref:uncharacterized protein LOC143228362 n=1 Tax=Tachypleus tridentatus TaxID=6853 RepID=UPI003FD39DFD